MIGKALFSYADKLVAADPASALEMVKAESFPEEIRTGALASIIQDMGGTHSGLPERLSQLAGDRAPEVAAAILAAPRTALPLETLNALTEIAARPHQPPQTR